MEAYFDKLAESMSLQYIFGKMNTERNNPTLYFKHIIHSEGIPQFFIVKDPENIIRYES